MASLTYVCFVPANGLIRDLSANSSNIAFEVPLASKWWWQSGLISHKHSQLRNMPFTNLKKVQEFYNGSLWLALHTYVSSLLRDSWETFRLTRQTSITIDESLGRDETYVCKANHCKILALSSSLWMAYYAIGNAYVIVVDVWRVGRKVPDESLGRDETYVCKASHNDPL